MKENKNKFYACFLKLSLSRGDKNICFAIRANSIVAQMSTLQIPVETYLCCLVIPRNKETRKRNSEILLIVQMVPLVYHLSDCWLMKQKFTGLLGTAEHERCQWFVSREQEYSENRRKNERKKDNTLPEKILRPTLSIRAPHNRIWKCNWSNKCFGIHLTKT